jgi:hypothetical protein
MQHYISLYVLASKFRMPKLGNQVIDLVRVYYRNKDMTAPPFRLNFIYQHTTGDNAMRRFLVASAAYRVLKRGNVSNVMRDIISAGGQLPVDLVKEMVKMYSAAVEDPRQGPNCAWHDHTINGNCLLSVSGDLDIPKIAVQGS